MIGRADTMAQLLVSAHDRAPKLTSQIDIAGHLFRRGEVTAGHIDIEIPIVVKVGKLSSPGPTRFGYLKLGWLATGNQFERVSSISKQPVAVCRAAESWIQNRKLGW